MPHTLSLGVCIFYLDHEDRYCETRFQDGLIGYDNSPLL